MPTYQYACTACDERLEAVQSFTDAPLTECPACGGTLRKVFSAVGVVFKGSGFYKNDSRKTASSESKSETNSETKTDAKADSGSGDKAAATTSGSSAGDSTSSSKAPAPAAPASKTA